MQTTSTSAIASSDLVRAGRRAARALAVLVVAVLGGACADSDDDDAPDPDPDPRCGGGAPQCCCDTRGELERYEVMCRAECEDNPAHDDWSCVSETACGS